jgi:hypothetical protein
MWAVLMADFLLHLPDQEIREKIKIKSRILEKTSTRAIEEILYRNDLRKRIAANRKRKCL